MVPTVGQVEVARPEGITDRKGEREFPDPPIQLSTLLLQGPTPRRRHKLQRGIGRDGFQVARIQSPCQVQGRPQRRLVHRRIEIHAGRR